MGIHDRAYARDDPARGPAWNFSGMPWVTRLVILNVAIYLIDSLSQSHPLSAFMAADTDLFRSHFKIYQLITAGFAHAPLGTPHGLWHILGNMFVFWVLGREVERELGWREFLCFYLVAIVIANLAWWATTVMAAPSQPASVIGASGGVSAVVILFAFLFPKRTVLLMFFIQVPAWAMGLIWVGLDIFGMMSWEKSGVAFSAHLGGAAFAAMYRYSGIRLLKLGTWMKRFTPTRRRSPLKIHRPEKSKEEQLEREGDRVLAKVYREGESSLTAKERRILAAYSRKMRNKHGGDE